MASDVVAIVGCGLRPYREYLLARATARHSAWLFLDSEPTWQRPYLEGWSVVDVYDQDKLAAAVAAVGRHRRVSGILSWDETLVVATAAVAERLGMPGPGRRGIEGCRDKQLSRRTLSKAGLAQPRSTWVGSADDALIEANQVGFPVVIKPRGMGASMGVALATDAAQVKDAFDSADHWSRIGALTYRGGALIEEFLPGPEISIDAAVVDGEYLPFCLAHKLVGLAPAFEEIGHTVDPTDPLLDDGPLLNMLAKAHVSIGFKWGITHTEVKLTPRGPVIVEINGRLGGDLIPFIGWLATGIDPGAVAVDVARGRRPVLKPIRKPRTVGIRFGYPTHDCRVRSVQLPQPTDPDHVGLIAAEALVAPGQELLLPPNGYIARHSYVICAGDSAQDCRERLDRSIEHVRLDVEPLSPKTQSHA